MTLVKWRPRTNMFNLFDEIDKIVQNSFVNTYVDRRSLPSYLPSMGLNETGSEYSISIDVPGVNKKDIDINLENGILNISGERKANKLPKDSSQLSSEMRYGKFSRSLKLPSNIIEDGVKAKYNNGVLTIILVKAKDSAAVSRKIAIS